jgi:transcriptional regulator with XRE-family HTH domain
MTQLSHNQRQIYDAFMDSAHSLNTIAKRSGYTVCTIRNWLKGTNEPRVSSFINIMDTLEALSTVEPARISWPSKIEALRLCRDRGMTIEEMSREFGATFWATRAAISRYLKV